MQAWSEQQRGRAGRAASTARVFDVGIALLIGVFAVPIGLLAALAIRMEGEGPVLFRQTRVGLGGRPFRMLKFRSMHLDAERDGIPRWAAEDDPRVTRVGQVLRKTRIDELPQLWNVLKGDMSVIGPRPERPVFVDTLTREISGYARRHSVKPGITGWAQVRHGYTASPEQAARKLDYDLYYLNHRTLLLDLRILLETVGVVVFGRGAR